MGAQGGTCDPQGNAMISPAARSRSAPRPRPPPRRWSRKPAALDETLAKLNDDMETLQAKLKDAKARQNVIVMRGKAARSRLGIRRQLSDHSVDDAMLRFEQYESRIDDLEGQVESYDMGQKTLAAEIDALEGDETVDAELRRLKERVQQDDQPRDAN